MSALEGDPAADRAPFEVIQSSLRRLSNGDYLRIEVEKYGTRARVTLGFPDGPVRMVWRWEMVLPARDLAWIIRDIAFALNLTSEHGEGIIRTTTSMLEDAKRQLGALNGKTDGESPQSDSNVAIRGA